MAMEGKASILQLGDSILYNPQLYQRLSEEFIIIQTSAKDRERTSFLDSLRSKRWGDFQGIFRPSMADGDQMGRWDDELISLLPDSVRIYGSAGAGFDWVDTEKLAEKGIVYTNGGDSASESVAEMAIFHIISVFRNLNISLIAARSNDAKVWRQAHEIVPLTSHTLQGRILGIIGLGSIGFKIAVKAHRGFDMKIHYFDTVRKSEEQETLIGATYEQNVDSLVAVADCVVLATPFGGDKMINAELLAKFKRGARFVNIARGALVDEAALLASVRSEHLLGVGLDVFENEPAINPGFSELNTALLTTHSAGGTIETFAGFERLAMENVRQYLLHGRALTPVNLGLLKKSKAHEAEPDPREDRVRL